MAPLLKNLIETDNFKVTVVDDVETVEICGALKVGRIESIIKLPLTRISSNHSCITLEYRCMWCWIRGRFGFRR